MSWDSDALRRPATAYAQTLGTIFMRQILTILLLTIQLTSCVDKSKSDVNVSSDSLDQLDTTKGIFIDSGVSRFEILSGENSGYDFKTIETNYKLVFLSLYDELKHYFAKYLTTTKTCTGCEGQERNIDVRLNSFDSPAKTVRTINKNCDDLILDAHTYKTIVYGCCGGEDQLEIYDYNSKAIIEGDSKIILGDIPNSDINLFIAYKQETNDTTTLGTLYLSYSASDRYAIKIKSKPLPEDLCSLFTPDISVQTSDSRDKYSEANNEYTFWSLDKIDSQRDVNKLTIRITYDCESELNLKPIDIPIIGGKPFGKDSRDQEIIFGAE